MTYPTIKPHKHAEVLRAIADGKEVQFKYGGDCWMSLHDGINPITHNWIEWRIKPEPKPDYCLYAGYDGNYSGSCLRQNEKHIVTSAWKYLLKITLDGETNEPKSVELVK